FWELDDLLLLLEAKGGSLSGSCRIVAETLVPASDVSLTPERICGSGSSKGTTGSDSDLK
ncbi:hypothetical protein AVEN_29559-1, partial [Araneus ventricosus]